MGGNKKKTKTSYENRRELPAYMTEGSQRAVQMAMDRSRSEYSQYGGDRIADLSQNEQLGIAGFRDEQGRYDADFDKARGALDADVSEFMNPYVENVLDVSARKMDTRFGEQQAELKRTAGMRNAFGGRANVAEESLGRRADESMSDMWTQRMGTAFDKGMANKFDTASAYGQVAQQQSGVNSQNLRNMMDSGFVGRTQEQADKDFQYLEHLEGRDWDVANLNTLVQTLAAVPSNVTESGESTTVEKTSQSPIKAIAGIAAITAGAIMTGGMSLTTMGGALTKVGENM